MALKAEAPLLDYLKVSLKCKAEKDKEGCQDPLLLVRAPGRSDEAGREQPVPDSGAGVTHEEPGSSWSQEYLIAETSEHGQPVCMVCGAVLRASGPTAARKHILQHHAHSLGFSVEEKRNILEAWSEGAVLPKNELPPSLAASPGKSKRPAEIEVLLDPEEQPASRKRGQLKARCEVLCLDPEHQMQPQPRQNNLSSAKDPRPKQLTKTTGKEWLSDCGVPGSAPAEIRIFTDGTFPAGFALKLYCRTQPEPPRNSGAKPEARSRALDRECSVSLLRLNSNDSPQLCRRRGDPDPRALASPPGTNAKACARRPHQPEAPTGKEDASLLAKGFDPAWRARFLMDFDPAAGRLICMVCEYPLRQAGLAAVKRHILQCHAETLHLPREVRRAIREVWESRGQAAAPAPQK